MKKFRAADFRGCFFMNLFNGVEVELRNKMYALHFFYCSAEKRDFYPTVNQNPYVTLEISVQMEITATARSGSPPISFAMI